MNTRHVSSSGIATLVSLECCILRIYDDGLPYPQPPWDGCAPKGHLTVGVGHCLTAADIVSRRFADGITKDQALALLARDLITRELIVCTKIHPEIGQHQFDALVIFVFNWGHVPPEIADAINDGDLSAATIRPMWLACNRGNGKAHLLDTRRAKEFALWIEPDAGPDGPGPDMILASVDAAAAAIVGDEIEADRVRRRAEQE